MKQMEEVPDPRAVNQDKTNMLFSVTLCSILQAYFIDCGIVENFESLGNLNLKFPVLESP